MGENGELHAMADKCFDILAGKYTYEVCVFGRASQKEGQGGGTSLGNWKGTERDPETGDRMLLWTDGQKCWNGPKRSATVYVTCGSETKVISADEPETCTYVFEMTSHIACDDEYKTREGL
jgi:protein kinase C substrate 80K-H